MTKWGFHKQLLLPLAAGAAFLLSAGMVLAGNEINVTMGPGGGNGNGGGGQQISESDSKSLLRQWTWENSFDKAGDANQDLEKSLAGEINFRCEQYQQPFDYNGQKYAASPQLYAECQRRQAAARHFRADVSGIKKQQRAFAEVSRISDAAAAASIGAAGYAEVWQKQKSQSSVFQSAASLEEKASIAAYTTGAADLSMGAWAYVQQKRKLEQIQQTLNGKSSGVSASSGNAALNSRLTKAIEETKQAAYNHMLWGAGKVAAGYAGMKLAERTRQQAKNLESIELYNATVGTAGTVSTAAAASAAAGSSVTMASNVPNFSLAATESSTATATATTGGGYLSGTGASSMPSSAFGSGISRQPAGGGGVSDPGGGGSLSAGATPTEAEEKAAAEEEKAVQEAVQKTAFGYGEYGRGGGSMSTGGGSAAADKEDPAAALGGIVGNIMGNGDTASVASRLNANQIADEAAAGLDGSEQGSMAGVSGNRDRSLFDTIKVKYSKALQAGNLVGPNTRIEVRN